MKGRSNGNQIARGFLSLLGVAGCFSLAALSASAEEGPPASTQTQAESGAPQPSAGEPAAVPEGASGMKGYVDPQTGRIRSTPAPSTPPLQLTPREQNSLSTSHQDLVEVPGSQPGGGMKLDLQGRFQSPLIGTIDADGKVKMHHPGEMPGSRDKK